jgi:transcriptional regulator with XRE-family HTH domain
MRLYWTHVWRSPHYQRADAEERRLIEIRFSLARKLHSTRRRQRVTQQQLAQRLGVAQSSISRVERASNRVSLDIAVRALIHLGCSDAEIAASFNVAEEPGVACLRRRAEAPRPFAPRPSDPVPPAREHRFLRKGSEWLPRLK